MYRDLGWYSCGSFFLKENETPYSILFKLPKIRGAGSWKKDAEHRAIVQIVGQIEDDGKIIKEEVCDVWWWSLQSTNNIKKLLSASKDIMLFQITLPKSFQNSKISKLLIVTSFWNDLISIENNNDFSFEGKIRVALLNC